MYIAFLKKINVMSFIGVFLIIIFLMEISPKLIYPLKFDEYVLKYSKQNNIDPYLVFAVIKAESGFDNMAISHKDAKGLMQITQKTGEWGANNIKILEFNNKSLFDPETNIRIGIWYLAVLMKQFNNNIDLAIAAYNGGSGNVNIWLKDKSLSIDGENLEKIPFKETHNFVKRVKNYYYAYKMIYPIISYK